MTERVRRKPYSVILMNEIEKAHADVIQKLADEALYPIMTAKVMDIVGHPFRPGFINRIDEAVGLGREQIRAIFGLQIDYLRKCLQEREIGFKISEAALDLLGEAGFDPVYGAWPMKRAIQQPLENPLPHAILAGQFSSGDTLSVGLDAAGFFVFQ